MAESNPVMTASLPNMEQLSDLDKLSERLGKFKAPHCNTSSRLPKPEISPKPAHLVAQLAKHKVPGSPANSSSSNAAVEQKAAKKKTSSVNSPGGTSSMLKSTLKRMTKLTTSPVSRSSSFKDPQEMAAAMKAGSNGSLKNPPMLNRSNSLRKMRNKDKTDASSSSNFNSLSRSGTSGTLDRALGVKRTPSMTTVRRFRDKDLNVKLSRGVQTQLTKDTVDEPEFTDDGSIPTSLDFTVYLPDLFGGDTDQVETHVSEPTEPIDVRKNRQLTLDNMKLHRELEKLKQSANEHDMVKKELRSLRAKYEEEQKARSRLEITLEQQNKKVKQIVSQMDGIEREFEKRDATIYDLEGQVGVEKSKVENLEAELGKASRIIESQKHELMAARKMQKTLVEQCEHVEGESRELQEFLQIEKMALSETLKDAEGEVEKLQQDLKGKDNEIKEAEERCGHLVRLGEQRHQELLTSQQHLKTFSEMAKNMLINQGTELYQFSSKLASLTSKLTMSSHVNLKVKDSDVVRQEIEMMFEQLQQTNSEQKSLNCTDSLQNLSVAIEKRRRSESILTVNGNGSQHDNDAVMDHFDKLEKLVDNLLQERNSLSDDQNDPNQLNKNGMSQETLEEMRTKFMKHQQIYKANYEQAELEIKRMDELYQDLIENVLNTLRNMPDTLNSQPALQRLKELLETEASDSLSSHVTSPTETTNGSGGNRCKNGTVKLDLQNSSQENLSL